MAKNGISREELRSAFPAATREAVSENSKMGDLQRGLYKYGPIIETVVFPISALYMFFAFFVFDSTPGLLAWFYYLMIITVTIVSNFGKYAAVGNYLEEYGTPRGLYRVTKSNRIDSDTKLVRSAVKIKKRIQVEGKIFTGEGTLEFCRFIFKPTKYKVRIDHTVLHIRLPDEVGQLFDGVGLYNAYGHLALEEDGTVLRFPVPEFEDRYMLVVQSSQNRGVLKEMFTQRFVNQLINIPEDIYFEQEGTHMIFFKEGWEMKAEELDTFVYNAQLVYNQYLTAAKAAGGVVEEAVTQVNEDILEPPAL